MLFGEPSHTYIGQSPSVTPNPNSSASLPLIEDNILKRKWMTEYMPFIKPKKFESLEEKKAKVVQRRGVKKR